MKNKIKKTTIGIGAVLILLGGRVAFSEPGSQSDPLVTFSYVEKKFGEIKIYIDEKLNNINLQPEEKSAWEVVEVSEGKSLICKDGTELILRSGKGIAISNISKIVENGAEIIIDNGLTDVTDGNDLKMGDNIPRDHLLIVPRDDGRGVSCTKDSFFLVKGDYIIE